MEMIWKKLREQRGEIALRLGFGFLGAILLFLVVLNIRHVYQVIDVVIDRTNEAVLAVAAINGPGSAGGVREGEATARYFDGAAWQRAVSSRTVADALHESLGGMLAGNTIIREGNYRIDNLSTAFVNQNGGKLHFTTTMDISISLLVGGGALSVNRRLEVKTTYEPKF